MDWSEGIEKTIKKIEPEAWTKKIKEFQTNSPK